MTGIAFAADSGGAAAAIGGAGGLMQLAPIILIFVVFYFLLIRPQQKQAKKHQQFLNDLKRGVKIVTRGGMHGVITDMDGNVLTLEIAKDVKIKISRDAVAGGLTKEGAVSVETAEPKSSGS
ncbi:MAG: preprotein translocase subunit YajC [Desulfobulbaceae bacterium]|jgi:preprotein translocase subunit YajC|nr:preprotein translocase subunit YajC [Desulfobulbaceae bacterium]